MKKLLTTLSLLIFTGVCFAQTTWTLNFGTSTGAYALTNSEIFSNVDYSPSLNVPTPSPASTQIARLRVGTTSQLGGFALTDLGSTTGGSGTRLKGITPTGVSSNKLSVYNIPSTKVIAFAFKIKFDAVGTDGEYIFSIGNNPAATNDFYTNGSGNANGSFAAVVWDLRASKHTFSIMPGSYTSANRLAVDATLNPVINNFIPNSEHTIEMFCNNTSLAISYSKNANNYTIAANKWQMWVDGIRIFAGTTGTIADFGVADGSATNPLNLDLNAFLFNAKSSTSQAVYYLDDFVYSDFLPAPVVLPISLTGFTAKNQASKVELKWNTASESNNSHFDVQRSTDGVQYLNIGKVNGAGNSNSSLDYYFTDKSPASGINYYRLNQVDFDGKSTLIDPISVNMGFSSMTMNVYAAPNSSNVDINISAERASKSKLIIYNLGGQKVLEQAVSLAKGNNTITVNLSDADKGIFIATLDNGTQVLKTKFLR
jgi:hypothetical protein